MKKAALHNLGCKVNAYETEAMQEMLEKAEHIHELKYDDITELSIYLSQCGVGGDMPGMACLREPYIMHSKKEYKYSFTISKI